MAFTILALFATLFGTVDFGFPIFPRSTFQHAVREGARYAVTYRTVTGMGHDDSVKSIVKAGAMGFLHPTAAEQKIKIRYYETTTPAETAANAPGNIVEVPAEDYQWGWLAPLFRTSSPL